jgi:hypothetical protein
MMSIITDGGMDDNESSEDKIVTIFIRQLSESPLWRVPFVDHQVDYRDHGC